MDIRDMIVTNIPIMLWKPRTVNFASNNSIFSSRGYNHFAHFIKSVTRVPFEGFPDYRVPTHYQDDRSYFYNIAIDIFSPIALSRLAHFCIWPAFLLDHNVNWIWALSLHVSQSAWTNCLIWFVTTYMGTCLTSTKTALTPLHCWSGFYHPAIYNKWPTAFADIPVLLFIVYIKYQACNSPNKFTN